MLKFLIIGLGSMGKRRLRCLRALGETLVAGYDPAPDRRREAAQAYHIPVFDHWRQALEFGANVWIISSPPKQHLGYALQALEKNIHVFTEADVPDPLLPKLLDRLHHSDAVAAPSCTMRYFPGPAAIRAHLQEGSLERPLLFTYHSGQYLPDWHPWEDYRNFYAGRRETGAAREIVAFELTWLSELFGEVETVTAMKGQSGELETDIDDYYQLLLRFRSGLVGHLLVDALSRPAVRSFRLTASAGTLEWDQGQLQVRAWTTAEQRWKTQALSRGTMEKQYVNPEEPYIQETGDFIAAIRGQGDYPLDFVRYGRVLRILEQAEENSV